MQQRRLRLGDILDDYCPRERRITNHAVVAMIDDQVKQTRCTTCDADHEYKEARIPAQRRRKTTADADAAGRLRPAGDEPIPADMTDPVAESEPALDALEAEAPPDMLADDPAADHDDLPLDDDGPVHRRLIRATLPRPEGQSPERKEPEFTIRQPGMRAPGNKRGRQQRSRGQGNFSSRFDDQRAAQRHGNKGPRQAGGAGHPQRAPGQRPAGAGAPRGNRQGPAAGRGGRRRGR